LTTAFGADQNDDVAPSIVKIHVVSSAPDFTAPWQRSSPQKSLGSGFVIDGNRILTNAHLVADQVHLEVQRMGTGRRFSAEVEHLCDPCDLAILSVADERFFDGVEPLEIGDLPRPKQAVRVYGFPEGGDGLSVTEGVVSRIQFATYAHSGHRMLMAQIDAAINAGNSGGPVVADGRVIGVSMQVLEKAENIGHIVPAPLIEHFLADIRDGRFDGFPELGVLVQALESESLRRRLGMRESAHGVLVTAVARRGSAHGVIEPGDVLLATDDVPILEDNTIELDRGLRIESTLVEHRRQVGDKIRVSLMREGRNLSRMVEMRAPMPVVHLGHFDRSLDYRIFGGLVFQPLTARYLTAFESVPDHLARFMRDPVAADFQILGGRGVEEQRRQIVVLTGLLANELTRGYEDLEDEIVYAVDDHPIRDLAHLSDLLDRGTGDLVTITTERGGFVVLDRMQARTLTPEVLRRYQVGGDRSPQTLAVSEERRREPSTGPASALGAGGQ
jgi:S1-C subfamily serine protease